MGARGFEEGDDVSNIADTELHRHRQWPGTNLCWFRLDSGRVPDRNGRGLAWARAAVPLVPFERLGAEVGVVCDAPNSS